MLKVKFWRIENVVLMKVLEQGEEIKRGCKEVFESVDFSIYSQCTPSMYANGIYVRGSKMEDDNKVRYYCLSNCAEAKLYIERATEAIHEYNQSLSKDPEQISDDIETVIAE